MCCRRARATIGAFAVVRAFNAYLGEFVAHTRHAMDVRRALDTHLRRLIANQPLGTILVGNATRRRRNDARVRCGFRVADLAHWAIGVFVANALIHGIVAIAAAAFRTIGAHHAELFGAISSAAITGHCIAVVTPLVGLKHRIATSCGHAGIWRSCRIANFARAAIHILITRAYIHVAQTTPAGCACSARFSEFNQAARIASIARCGVAVVAPFVGFEHRIATTSRHADIRIGRCIAKVPVDAIAVVITCTDVASRIAISAFARIRRTIAGLSFFKRAQCAAAIAAHDIAVVAAFVGFENEVTASRIHAFVGQSLGIANLTA